MIEKSKTKEFWDSVAESTDTSSKTYAGMLSPEHEYYTLLREELEQKHLTHIISLNHSMRVLEVGCGGGRWSFFLANKVKQVVGIDFSSQMISLANQALKELETPNVEFHETELVEFKTDHQFELIYFSGVLQYLSDEDINQSLAHAKTLLAPGGVLLSRDTIETRQRSILEGQYPVIYRTQDEYEIIFRNNGFNLTYADVSQHANRFASFCSKVYRNKLLTYRGTRRLHELLLNINNAMGDPTWLKKRAIKEKLNTTGVREHRFFRYEPQLD